MEQISTSSRIQIAIITLLAVFLSVTVGTVAQGAGPYEITWHTIDGGGARSSGGPYVLSGTIGQADAAYSAGGQYELLGGFWSGGLMCMVEFGDFVKLAEQWRQTGIGLAGDLNGDNNVDFEDLGEFAYFWLECCPVPWPLK